MLKQLIELLEEGNTLEQKRLEKVESSKYGAYLSRVKTMSGQDFDTWKVRAVNYLQENDSESVTVKEVLESYKFLQPETSYEFYEKLMAVLKAKGHHESTK